MKVLLKMGQEKELSRGVYKDEELNATIGLELKWKMVCHDYVFKRNKLERVTKMSISLDELENTDKMEIGRLSNNLFRYHVTDSKELTSFESATPQYRRLRNWGLIP